MPQIIEPKIVKQQASFHGDTTQARIAAVKNPAVKNPLSFTDPTDRQAATLARMQRIMTNPKYQQLSPEKQAKLRAKYYDKYVVPAYNSTMFTIPDKATWVEGVTKHGFKPEDYYLGTNSRQAANVLAGLEISTGEILHGTLTAGVWLGKQASLAVLGLDHFFDTSTTDEDVQVDKTSIQHHVDQAQKVIDWISHDTINSANFWLQTHPSKSIVEKADSFIGEQLIQLPFYESVGVVRAAGLGKTPGLKNLSTALSRTKTGAFVARRIGEATDALIGSTLQGQSKNDTIANMVSFATFGTAGEIAGAVGTALIKKFTANIIAQGGKPLVAAAVAEAEKELRTGVGANYEALKAKADTDPIKTKVVTSYKGIINSIARSNFGKLYKDLTPEQQLSVRALHKEVTAAAVREMPLHIADQAAEHTDQELLKAKLNNPTLAKNIDEFEKKYGIKISAVVHDAEMESTAEQTGVKSNQGVAKKVAKATKAVDAKVSEETAKAQEEEPKRFAQMKIDHLAYFKNPRPKRQSKDLKTDFDYDKWLLDMNSNNFLSELRSHMGNHWFFENPNHLLTWSYQFRKEMPKPFARRIRKELEDYDPWGNPTKWAREATTMAKHLKNMAITGRLFTEGNIFRSTRTVGQRSPWQKELADEAKQIEKEQLKTKMSGTKKHYPKIDKQTQRILDTLQEIIDTEPK